MSPFLLFIVSIIAIVCLPIPAQAYIDIGSVSLILQAIIAALVSTVVFFQVNWTNFKKIIKKFSLGKPNNGASNEKSK